MNKLHDPKSATKAQIEYYEETFPKIMLKIWNEVNNHLDKNYNPEGAYQLNILLGRDFPDYLIFWNEISEQIEKEAADSHWTVEVCDPNAPAAETEEQPENPGYLTLELKALVDLEELKVYREEIREKKKAADRMKKANRV